MSEDVPDPACTLCAMSYSKNAYNESCIEIPLGIYYLLIAHNVYDIVVKTNCIPHVVRRKLFCFL